MNAKTSGSSVSKFLLLAAILSFCSCSTMHKSTSGDSAPAIRQQLLLDSNWLFHRGDVTPQPVSNNYDDKTWQHVDVPHDYILDGKYADSPEKTVRGHGYLPYDVA